MAESILGRILPVFKGDYNNVSQYQKLDIVYYGGSSYVAKGSTKGNLPTNENFWQIVAVKGELTGELTAAQQQAIVAAVVSAGGFVSDSSYVHTDNNFTDELRDMLNGISVGSGTLTLRRNGVAIGTFGANSSSNSVIDITVPMKTSQLTNDASYQTAPKSQKVTSDGGAVSIVADAVADHEMLYVVDDALTELEVVFSTIQLDEPGTWNRPSARIIFDVSDGFAMSAEGASVVCVNFSSFVSGGKYMARIDGGVVSIMKIN